MDIEKPVEMYFNYTNQVYVPYFLIIIILLIFNYLNFNSDNHLFPNPNTD